MGETLFVEILQLFFLLSTLFTFTFANNVTTKDPVSGIRHLFPKADISDFAPVNVTVQQGSTAYLPCRFRHLADYQVSWIRRRDWHILTTGVVTYTSDNRFTVQHPPETDIWTLQLKYAQAKDSGTYECQLSTGTGSASQFVNFEVVVPQAKIIGGPELHVQRGSSIKLVCLIEESPTPPDYLFWYINNTMVNYDKRGGINVSTELSNVTTSRLTINNASVYDSGNYSCLASNSMPAYTNVFVSIGDKMAAIQRRKSTSSSSPVLPPSFLFFSFLSSIPFILPLLFHSLLTSIIVNSLTFFSNLSFSPLQ